MNDKLKYILTGGSCLIIGLVGGINIAGNLDVSPIETNQTVVSANDDKHEYGVDLEKLENEYEQALVDIDSSAQSNYRPDPVAVNGMKQAAEINEMLCKTRGINCEEAKLFRRQYEEMISSL